MLNESFVWDGHRGRLRQHMERDGWDALRPHEMVEMVLNQIMPRQDLSEVARALVTRFGSVGSVFLAAREDLLAVKDMTDCLADWVVLTGELMRAYCDLESEWDLRLSCFQEVQAFLRPRLPKRAGETVLWALYADFDFNFITYTDFGPVADCFDAPVARRLLGDAVGTDARYAYLVRFSDAATFPDAGDLARLSAMGETLRAAEVDLVDFVLVTPDAYISLRAEGLLGTEETERRRFRLREAYLEGEA